MTSPTKVLFLAAEAEPFIKIGGLGDVAGALPQALLSLPQEAGYSSAVDIRLVLPYHSVIDAERHGIRLSFVFALPKKIGSVQVQVFEGKVGRLPVYLLKGEPITASGSVYSADATVDAAKYTFFSLAALELGHHLGWTFDVLHCNDWHSALAAYVLWLRRRAGDYAGVASLLTVHNLAFMGPDTRAQLDDYGVPIAATVLPEWAQAKPLPLGLWAADRIVAVSPSYAEEIQSKAFGCGLEAFLQSRKETISGILNGIDVVSFDPAADSTIAQPFTTDTIGLRPANKIALQREAGLLEDPLLPLFASVSRMDGQKGVDLIPAALDRLRKVPWQFTLLGTGDTALEGAFLELQARYPDRVRIFTRYDAELARRIYAGADMLLMPSRYEPCGLAQMIGMRYGCVPIAAAVGGLRDTVREPANGFLLSKPSPQALGAAMRRALRLQKDEAAWRLIQQAGMRCNFSWSGSARAYAALYLDALSKEKRNGSAIRK